MKYRKMVKVRGLNKRKILVDRLKILYLEEAEIDERMVCNIHFTNGRWVTSGLGLDEIKELLDADENNDSEETRKRWKEQAKAKMLADVEVKECMRSIKIDEKIRSWHSSEEKDGTKKITIYLESTK